MSVWLNQHVSRITYSWQLALEADKLNCYTLYEIY